MSATTEQPASPTATTITAPPAEEESHKVFIGNLSFTSTDESLKAYFSDAGEVLETIIIKKGSRPKGYGFVAFRTLKEAEKAVKDFDKKELDGREISVQLANQIEAPPKPTAEKNKKRKSNNKKSRKTTAATSENNEEKEEEKRESKEAVKQEELKPKTSIFVANLPLSVKMNDLAELFKDYQVESVLVAIQRSGRSKGYGFVELKTVEEMNRVLKEFVDVEVQGRPIHVSAATSEKNTERRIKPKKVTTTNTNEGEKTTGEKSKKRNRKPAKKNLAAKENEGIEAAKEAKEAVRKLKEKDGVEAAHEAQEAVRELKEEDGVSAAKAANDAAAHATDKKN